MFLEIASFIDLLCSRMGSSHHFTLTAVYLPLFSFLVTSLSWDILTSVGCHKCNRTAVECLKFSCISVVLIFAVIYVFLCLIVIIQQWHF